MLRQDFREWTDARNADNRRHNNPCRRARKLAATPRARPLCACRLPTWVLWRYATSSLLGQKAAYDPHSTATVFDSAVMLAEPASDLLGDLHFPAAERTHFYLWETNSLLNSRSHRRELATATHTSQSPRFRLTVPNAGCRNGA